MSTDLRNYLNIVCEAIAPGSMTHVADKEQKILSDAVQQAESNIDKFIENGTVQGTVKQIHDEQGQKIPGQYQVSTDLEFYFREALDNKIRVRLAAQDIAPAIKKEQIMPFLQLLANKYKAAGYMVDPVVYSGGERGWIRLYYNRSDTPQG
jgi:hypothetical protein